MNNKVLESFVQYCKENPKQRFWQALRNWSGFSFVWVSNDYILDGDLRDTFYFTRKVN